MVVEEINGRHGVQVLLSRMGSAAALDSVHGYICVSLPHCMSFSACKSEEQDRRLN